MRPTPLKVRIFLRWLHIILGLVILCYVYSPWHRYEFFQWLIKLFIIPVLVVSGIWLWKFTQFNKIFGIKG